MSLRRLNQKERNLYEKRESRRPKIYEPQSDSESEQELAEHEKNTFFSRGKKKTKLTILITF